MPLRRLALASFALAAACSSKQAQESFSYVSVDPVNGGVDIETAGVRIELDGSLHFVSQSHTTQHGSSATNTLNGHPFGVREGVFFIGPSSYGAVREGSLVRVDERAVTVDGEERGPFPADAK